MIKLLTISEAAEYLGVTSATLRRWERSGKITPAERTIGGQRRYDVTQLKPYLYRKISSPLIKNTLAYARVSSQDQKQDLQRQEEMLALFCVSRGWQYEILSDLGSGLNYKKKGLKKLLEAIIADEIERLVLTHQDRLLRFGSELIFDLCEIKGIEVVLINQGQESTFEAELTQDVLEIMTVFSAKYYGSRSHKNKQLMTHLKKMVQKELTLA